MSGVPPPLPSLPLPPFPSRDPRQLERMVREVDRYLLQEQFKLEGYARDLQKAEDDVRTLRAYLDVGKRNLSQARVDRLKLVAALEAARSRR